jgi:hypothetical protein
VRRALRYALVVGAVLIAINHGDALLRGDLDGVRLFRIGLNVIVPYCVSTASGVEAVRHFRPAVGSPVTATNDTLRPIDPRAEG